MSAFLVSEEHIHYLVNAGLSRRIQRTYGLYWQGDHSDEDTSPRYALENGNALAPRDLYCTRSPNCGN